MTENHHKMTKWHLPSLEMVGSPHLGSNHEQQGTKMLETSLYITCLLESRPTGMKDG